MGAGDVTRLICFCDGELIDENKSAKYIGGYKKAGTVPSTIGFTSFKEKIREMINLPSNGIEFKIKCGVDFDEFTKIAIDVDDDKSLQDTMDHSKFIMAYIIKQMPPTTALTRTQREDLLRTDVNIQSQAMNFSVGTGNDNHDDELNPLEDVDNRGDVNADDNLGDEINPLEDGADREERFPLSIDNAHHRGIKLSMGNHDVNQGDEVNTPEDMHSEENISAPHLEERLSSASVDVHLQDSNCSMDTSGVDDFIVGKEFVDIDAFGNAFSTWAIKTGREYESARKTKSMWTMKCRGSRDSGCNWRMQAIRLNNLPTFKVEKYQNLHTCSGLQRRGGGDHCQANIKWIVSKMQSNIARNPAMGPKDIIAEIKNRFGIKISTSKAMKAKVKSLEVIYKKTVEDNLSSLLDSFEEYEWLHENNSN